MFHTSVLKDEDLLPSDIMHFTMDFALAVHSIHHTGAKVYSWGMLVDLLSLLYWILIGFKDRNWFILLLKNNPKDRDSDYGIERKVMIINEGVDCKERGKHTWPFPNDIIMIQHSHIFQQVNIMSLWPYFQ